MRDVLSALITVALASVGVEPDLQQAILAAAPDLPEATLARALRAVDAAGWGEERLLTLIDYGRPSRQRRLWVIDVERQRVLFHELVAHGKGSDQDGEAVRFSNRSGSHATSLGLYRTLGTYSGQHGHSLRLRGLDDTNDNAERRNIVIHGAWYVSEAFAAEHGRLGRSHGCPALDSDVARRLIDTIAGGTYVYIDGGTRRRSSRRRGH